MTSILRFVACGAVTACTAGAPKDAALIDGVRLASCGGTRSGFGDTTIVECSIESRRSAAVSLTELQATFRCADGAQTGLHPHSLGVSKPIAVGAYGKVSVSFLAAGCSGKVAAASAGGGVIEVKQ